MSGKDDDDDLLCIASYDRHGRILVLDADGLHEHQRWFNQLRARVHTLVTADSGTLPKLKDPAELKATLQALHADSELRKALKNAGGGLRKAEELKLLEQLVFMVKREKLSERDRTDALLKSLDTTLGNWLQPVEDDYESDVEIQEDSSIAGLFSPFSLTIRALNCDLDQSVLLTPALLLPSPDALVQSHKVVTEVGVCKHADQAPCLLCQVSKQTDKCAFQRRATYHWLRAYDALLYALWDASWLTGVEGSSPAQVAMLEALQNTVVNHNFRRGLVCPDVVRAVVARLPQGVPPTPRSLKVCLGIAATSIHAASLDALERSAGAGLLSELQTRLMALDKVQLSDAIDVEQSEAVEEVPGDCTLNRRNQVQCAPHPRCTNQPFRQDRPPHTACRMAGKKGMGLFANELIRAGSMVGEYKFTPISGSTLPNEKAFVVRLRSGTYVDGRSVSSRAKFANHACGRGPKPNCELQEWSIGGMAKLGLFTVVDVEPNAELTYTYETNVYFECQCGCQPE